MKRLLLFLASLPLLALQNGDFSGSNYLSFTGPSINFTDYRVEFRLSGFTSGGTQGIFGNNDNGGPHCLLVSGGVTLRCRDWQGAGDHVSIDLTGRTDVRVRWQRVYSTGVRTLEVWNSDGTGYTTGSITNAVGPLAFNATQYVGAYYGAGSQCTCDIGFVRWWTTTVAPASSAPPDALLLGYADVVDLELEGNTTDSSSNAVSITTTGGALSYATTTLYNPAAIITYTGAARAGATYALSGATSSNLTTDQPLTYFWQTPGWTIAAPTFSARTSSTTTITIPTTQTVNVRLRVIDGLGQTGTEDITLGAVATDTNAVVIQSDATIGTVLGENLRSGASPWTWFDTNEMAVADAIAATIPEFQGNATLAGTLTVTNGSATITGSGTSFASQFACDGSDNIVIHYPIDGGGGALGRRTYVVISCSGADMTIYNSSGGGYDASATASGVSFGKISNADNGSWANQSNNWNYYDSVAALYRLYYRTGNTDYRTQARALADQWWVYPIDGCRAWEYGQGTWQIPPRVMSVMGLMLRANDGRPEIWPQLMNCVSVPYTNLLVNYYPYQPNDDLGEIREQGYVFLFTQLAAIMHPDASTRATWQTNANTARDYFLANQTAYGGWTFSLGANQNYYGSGNFPWHGFPLMQALRLNYEATGSTTAKASLKSYIDYIIAEGLDATNDGGYYEDTYFTWCPDYSAERTGTVIVTNGSAVVRGSGTQFQSQYACNGTDTIAIQDSGGFRRGYTVASCVSQTAMTLATTYAGPTEGGLRILVYSGTGVTPPSACHNSYGTDAANASAARTLLNALHSFFGWAYKEYGTASYLTIGDRLFAQNLGLNGPGNDGVVGQYASVVSGGTAPQYLANTYLGKEFASVGGAGGSQSYLALRLGGVTPLATVNLTFKARRADVLNATKFRITVTVPSGTTYTNTCSADTCIVSNIDRRQGNGLAKYEFLSSGDAVLAISSPQPVTIQ